MPDKYEPRWYHFWDPRSGPVGGIIAGLLILLLLSWLLLG